MNVLYGIIDRVDVYEELALIDINVKGELFSAILTSLNRWGDKLKVGQKVRLLFKETEVGIGREIKDKISIRNVFESRIMRLRQGPVLSEIVFDFKGVEIISMITTRSITKLKIETEIELEWFIKSTEVSVMEDCDE